MRRAALVLLAPLALAAVAAPARAVEPVDWNAAAGLQTIEVVTGDPGGSARATTVWLAVLDGHGYIRSSGTRWLANLERDPDLLVRIGADEYPLRAVKVRDSRTREAVLAVFREKYGVTDLLLGPIRSLMGTPTILRLEPRTSLAPVD